MSDIGTDDGILVFVLDPDPGGKCGQDVRFAFLRVEADDVIEDGSENGFEIMLAGTNSVGVARARGDDMDAAQLSPLPRVMRGTQHLAGMRHRLESLEMPVVIAIVGFDHGDGFGLARAEPVGYVEIPVLFGVERAAQPLRSVN